MDDDGSIELEIFDDEPLLTPSLVLESIGIDPTEAGALKVLRAIPMPPPSPGLSVPSIATASDPRDDWGCSVVERRVVYDGCELDDEGSDGDESVEDDEELPARPWPPTRRFRHVANASATSISGLSAFSFHFHPEASPAGDEQEPSSASSSLCALERAGICLALDLFEDYEHSRRPHVSGLTPLDVLPVLAQGIDEHELDVHLDHLNEYDLDLPDPRQFTAAASPSFDRPPSPSPSPVQRRSWPLVQLQPGQSPSPTRPLSLASLKRSFAPRGGPSVGGSRRLQLSHSSSPPARQTPPATATTVSLASPSSPHPVLRRPSSTPPSLPGHSSHLGHDRTLQRSVRRSVRTTPSGDLVPTRPASASSHRWWSVGSGPATAASSSPHSLATTRRRGADSVSDFSILQHTNQNDIDLDSTPTSSFLLLDAPLSSRAPSASSGKMIGVPMFFDERMYFERRMPPKPKTPKASPKPSPKPDHADLEDSRSFSFKKSKRGKPHHHDAKDSFFDGFLDVPDDRVDQAPQPPAPHGSYAFHPTHHAPPSLSPPSSSLRLDTHTHERGHDRTHERTHERGHERTQDRLQLPDESKRPARWSQFTSSSTSSDQSSSNRHHNPQMWSSLAEQRGPSFATVFEDEALDAGLELDPYSSLGLSTTSSSLQSPPSSLPSPPAARGAPKRSKKKTQHPFAINRSPSPLLDTPKKPSLYDQYNRMASDDSPALQVALLSPQDDQEGQECPVCCESLSSSYRLPGEKPHIVPECGHAIHDECFVTVYGRVPPEGSNIHIGVCGVCRQPMRVTHGSGSDRAGRSKLAALVGNQQGMVAPHTGGSSVQDIEVDHDDPVEPITSLVSRTPPAEGSVKVVVPRISIRSEYPSVRRARAGNAKQHVTAMVTIEIPSATDRSSYAARPRQESMSENAASPQLPPSPLSTGSIRDSILMSPPCHPREGSNPMFAHVQADLRRRVHNYQTAGLDNLGPLTLFDILHIRKGTFNREFHVYLFNSAVVFIQEEKKASFRSMFHKHPDPANPKHNTVLKIKGRIFLSHVDYVTDTSTQNELSLLLTTDNEVEGSKQLLLIFKDRSSHEMWKSTVLRLIESSKEQTKKKPSANLTPHAMGLSPSVNGSLAPTYNDFDSHSPVSMCPPACMGDLAYGVPIAPHHTPIDLVIAISTQASASGDTVPLKVRLLRSSLQFVLACMGPRDRVSLVATELGANGVVRRTPFLNATLHDSRARLEYFVELLGSGRADHNHDEYEVRLQPDERPDVVTAINCSLDVILQRKTKNPLTNMVLISDSGDIIKRGAMGMVQARLDAAKVPVHTFGYGKAHDPAALWMVSNHTHATYTFVKEWYHLRDAMAGILGGFMSIALTNMKLRLTTQDDDFRVVKVSGTSSAVVSASGKEIDIEIPVLRHDERREILVEFELDGEDISSTLSRHLSINSNSSMHEGYEDSLDEVPVVEIDCSFHDPEAGRSATRLANPVLLTLAVLPPSAPQSNTVGDPRIVRRRMEVLASDMITRSLVIAARKNFGHATRILRETKRVIDTMATAMRGTLPGQGVPLSRHDAATMHSLEGLAATMQDVDMFLEGLEVNKEMFTMDHRNFAAQQAIVLRSQRSWTVRTPTELHYATPDVQALIQLSADYASSRS